MAKREIRVTAVLGTSYPLSVSAPGKAFLTKWSDAAIKEAMQSQWVVLTPHSVTSIDPLMTQIKAARISGIAHDWEEHADDICAMATLAHAAMLHCKESVAAEGAGNCWLSRYSQPEAVV